MKKSLFIAEWKEIFRDRKVLIPIIAVIFIPILYSGMFLWAFWDPYEHLEDMPVAIVNNDIGAEFEGKDLTLGEELVDKLKENDEFAFHFVNKEEGYRDLEKQKYYILVEIPENFSENATTLMDDHPKKLELHYIPNESFNFLSAQIGETAVKEIKAAISKEVTATYAETIFDSITEMADGFDKASDGAGELNDGAIKLKDGSKTLKENLELLAEKSIDFKDGVTKAQSGTKELAEGTNTLASGLNQLASGHDQLVKGANDAGAGANQLVSGAGQINAGLGEANAAAGQVIAGTEQIQAGANTLSQKMGELQGGAGGITDGANQVHAGIQQLQAELTKFNASIEQLPLPEEVKQQLAGQFASLTPEITKLEKGSAQVANGTKQLQQSSGELQKGAQTLSGSIGELANGQQQLKAGLNELYAGSSALHEGTQELANGHKTLLAGMNVFHEKLNEANSGANKLSNGATQLLSGMGELSEGSLKISDGTHQLADGSKELADGTVELEDGTKELKDKLYEAADKAGDVQTNDETYDMMGEPVEVENKPINEVPNYGTGFAPYFLSLGLFVGALLLSIVYHLREPVERPKNGFTWFMSKFGVIAVVGLIQSILAVVIMLFGLGIEVQSVPLFILTTVVTSFTFVTLIQFLVTLFADPGRFIAIILLILQLTTSAGTFPLELIPKVLQPLNLVLPMTYSVQAYKAVISSGDYSVLWNNLGILMIFIISFMVLTLGYFISRHKRQFYIQGEEAAAN